MRAHYLLLELSPVGPMSVAVFWAPADVRLEDVARLAFETKPHGCFVYLLAHEVSALDASAYLQAHGSLVRAPWVLELAVNAAHHSAPHLPGGPHVV